MLFFLLQILTLRYPQEVDGQRRALTVKATHFLNFFIGLSVYLPLVTPLSRQRVKELTCVNEVEFLSQMNKYDSNKRILISFFS